MLNRNRKVHARKLTIDEISQVASYSQINGVKKTAQDFSLSPDTVYRAMRKCGVEVNPQGRPREYSDDFLAKVAAHAQQKGKTATMWDFGISLTVVNEAMKKHRVKSWKNGRPKDFTEEERKSWVASGMNAADTARRFGICKSTILRVFHKHGVKLQKRGRPKL